MSGTGILCVCVREIPVGMWGREHELELYYTGVVLQLSMLNAVELVGNVRPAHIHLRLLEMKQQKWLVRDVKLLNLSLSWCRLALFAGPRLFISPPVQPSWRPDCCGRRSWAEHQRWTSQKGSVSRKRKKKRYLAINFQNIRLSQQLLSRPWLPTCRFSMQNWCPYMSMAERKMDSTWLCRSS